MSIRVMLDTDTPGHIEAHSELLATYTDLIRTHDELATLKAKHPHSEIILIDRGLGDPTGEATVFDMEANADSINQLPEWIKEKKAAGKEYLTGYCDRNNLKAVVTIAHHEIWHWIATLDGTCHIPGFVPLRQPAAVQILGSAFLGVHADLSIVLEDRWHPRKTAAAAAAAPWAAEPFQPAADLPGEGSDGGGDAAAVPAAQVPDAPPAPAMGLHDLAGRAPAWDFYAEGQTVLAHLRGTRSQIEGQLDDLVSLAARIRQLYPDTIK